MEYLSRLIHRACDNSMWSPFSIGRNSLPISHLLFADDVLLFGETDSETLFALKNTLSIFSEMSGQTINMDKSKLFFSPNTSPHVISFFEETLHISSTKDLGLYLGFPLSPLKPKKRDLQFIGNKVRGKLSSWKAKWLSKAGRLCLINSTLTSIPSYYMSSFLLPKSILTEIDTITSNFFWGESNEKKKNLHLIAWDHISRPTNVGRLGIRSTADLNLASMIKLCWKLFATPSSLASLTLKEKYIKPRPASWHFNAGSHIWKSVGKGWDLFIKNINWNLGDGEFAFFWSDNWLGVGSLRSSVTGPLHELDYSLKVRRLWHNGEWDLSTSSLALSLPTHILNVIYSCHCLPPGHPDSPYSTFAPKGVFKLDLAYSSLKPTLRRDRDLSWIWKVKTLPKIKIFLWLCFWDRLPHKVTLSSRGMPTPPFCSTCTTVPEDCIHLLRDCPRATSLWNTMPIKQDFFSLDLHSWLHHNLMYDGVKDGPLTTLPWPTLFSFCL